VGSFTLVVRSHGEPAGLASSLRAAVRAVDPELPLYAVRTLEDLVAENTAQRRLAVVLLGVFAAIALALAVVGIYGVMAYSVEQRTPEIGIRMALGAHRRDILSMMLKHGLTLALGGIALGLLAALALARLIASLLFGVGAADLPTFALVPLLLVGVAALACYLPARRATRVDPLVALRYE
jgi:putative ABC transport system permease protein